MLHTRRPAASVDIKNRWYRDASLHMEQAPQSSLDTKQEAHGHMATVFLLPSR